MKLVILFFLFSILVFSDASVTDDLNESAQLVAQRQFSLLNGAVITKNKELLRDVYDIKPGDDAKVDKILSEYQFFKFEVRRAQNTILNRIAVIVDFRPRAAGKHKKPRIFGMQKTAGGLTGWKIDYP